MKRILRILFFIFIAIIFIAGSGILYISLSKPNIPLQKDIHVEITPDRLARGHYLANHVTVCMDCHSTREWDKFAAPMKEGTNGMGGEYFGPEMGFPGDFYAPNITPANLKGWSDAELYRAITSGVTKDNRALFPVMPYLAYGKMNQEDIFSIIAYIRSLAPIENDVRVSEATFPMSLIMKTIPQPADPQPKPSPDNTLEYGKYLANAAGCIDCHTPFEKGQFVEGMDFAGGRQFPLPGGMLVSANITPDKETGIGNWTKEAFIARFKAYDPDNGYEGMKVGPKDFNTIMPWTMYSGMTEEDLGAIYTYIHSLPSNPHMVQHFIPKE